MQSLTMPANSSLRAPMPTLRRQMRPCRAAVQTFPSVARAPASFYEVLRVKENASVREIKSAYRSLAKVYHPDVGAESDGGDFIEIHNAYETLSDPSSRALYDMSLGLRIGSSSFGYYPVGIGRQATRRWETDQCW